MENITAKIASLQGFDANETKIIYSINEHCFDTKPSDSQIKTLKFKVHESSLKSLIDSACSGKTFTCANFENDSRSIKKFIGQSLFCIDIDGKITKERVEELLEDYGLAYNYGYYTFNHTNDNPRYRLLFLFNGIVRDVNLVKYIYQGFLLLFEDKIDKACLEPARMFFGTKNRYFEGSINNQIELLKFIEIINSLKFSKDRNQSRSLVTVDRIIFSYCAKSNNTIYTYNSNYQNCTKIKVKKNKKHKVLDIDDLLKFKLFKVFYEGKGTETKKDKLVHTELFGLATNLVVLENGKKLWKDCLDKNPNYSEEKYDLFFYIRNNGYAEMPFSNFSPFEEDRNNYFQSFSQVIAKKGKIEILDQPQIEYLTLEEGRKTLNEKYKEIIASNDSYVYVLKCPTGLGKTELIKNTENIVVAFPNHSLKKEHFDQSKLVDTKKIQTPTIDDFSDEVSNALKNIYKNGLHEKAKKWIEYISNGSGIKGLAHQPQDVIEAKKYLEEISKSKEAVANITIFTTHQRLLFSKYPHNTIVFDENPMTCFFEQGVVSAADVKLLLNNKISLKYDTAGIEAAINEDENIDKKDMSRRIYENVKIKFSEKQDIELIVLQLKIKSNIWGLLQCDFFWIADDKFIYTKNNIHLLPKDKKIIIADATPCHFLYKSIFGDRLKFIEIPDVKIKGVINQYTSLSCSRDGLRKYHEKINRKTDNWDTITFKEFKKYFSNSCDTIHFGKGRGTNLLQGKNLNVIGTPNFGPNFYKVISAACNLQVDDFIFVEQYVTYKNKKFKIATFTHPILQKIHLEILEAELIQTIQRARINLYDVTVNLFSNMPVPQANYIWWK